MQCEIASRELHMLIFITLYLTMMKISYGAFNLTFGFRGQWPSWPDGEALIPLGPLEQTFKTGKLKAVQ